MTLKTAAVLAFVGILLLSVLLAVDFVRTSLAFIRDVVPANAVIRSLVDLFASAMVTLFFYVFQRAQRP